MRFPYTCRQYTLEGLPREFTAVEYLETTGQQDDSNPSTYCGYINTGFVSTTTTEMQCRMSFSDIVEGTTTEALCGAFATDARFAWGLANINPKTDFYFGLGSVNKATGVTRDTNAHTFKLSAKNKTWAIDYTTGNFGTVTVSNGTQPICLFARLLGTGISKPMNGKIYYFKLWDNNVLVRDMIPALDKYGVPCMYDKVEKKAYYNAGNKAFSYGRQIKPVEYLQSTGTQYINTGIYLNNNYTVELDYQFTDVPVTNERRGLFGGLDSNGRYGALVSPTTRKLEFGYGSSNTYYQTGIPDTNRHVLKQDKNLAYFDGTLVNTFNTATFTMGAPATLGTFNYTNYTPAKAKYYASKWWDNGNLVRDYIPAIDENNVPFMFDKQNRAVYLNVGTGTFGYGSLVFEKEIVQRLAYTSVLPAGYKRVEYIEGSPTNTANGPYIDTGLNYFADVELTAKMRESASMKGCGVDQTHCIERENATTNAWRFRSDETTFFNTSALITDLHTLKWKDNKVYVDGNELGTLNKPSVSKNFLLFAVSATGTVPINRYPLLIYGCKLWNPSNGELVREYVPCLDSNNTPCLYDLITKTPYYNAGTLSFTYGDVIGTKNKLRLCYTEHTIPSTYKRLNYIESTGTQYIDTLWSPQSSNLRVKFRVQSNGTPRSTAICGAENSSIVPRWVFVMFGQSADDTKTFPLIGDWKNGGSGVTPEGFTFTDGTSLNIDWTANSTSTTITDSISGVTYTHTFDTTITYSNNTTTLKLFQNGDNQKSSINLYYYQIYDNNVLVRDFIPVQRKSDNKPGLWDRINSVFYTNAGTGEFSYG